MCHGCGLYDKCLYCGTYCEGTCNDPDSCRSCWSGPENCPTAYCGGMEEWDECEIGGCPCTCHGEAQDVAFTPFGDEEGEVSEGESEVSEGESEVSEGESEVDDEEIDVSEGENEVGEAEGEVQFESTEAAPTKPTGSFNFMGLVKELRVKILKMVLCQEGDVRKSPYFRGKIDTAVLYSGRQLSMEARDVLYRYTNFWFSTPRDGLYFLDTVKSSHCNLIKSCQFDLQLNSLGFHFDLHLGSYDGLRMPTVCHHDLLQRFLMKLAELEFVELRVTIMGAVTENWFDNQFNATFQPLLAMRSLKLRLIIGSKVIKNEEMGKVFRSLKEKYPNRKRKIDSDDKSASASNDRTYKRLRTAQVDSEAADTGSPSTLVSSSPPPAMANECNKKA